MSLAFEPIDLASHASVCVAFRRDSFICSFGVDRFFDEAGLDGVHYIERLHLRTAKFPNGYVHVWRGDEIFMRRHGVPFVQLSVSPTNMRALAFYRKHGWRDLGLRPGRDNVHLMQRDVPADDA